MEEKRICLECGCIIEDDEYYVASEDGYICEDCYMDDYCTCDICGEIIHVNDSAWIESEQQCVCDDCIDRLYEKCEECGEYIKRCDAYNTRNGYVCECCRDRYYQYCYECDELVHMDDTIYNEDNGEYYCQDCYHNLSFEIHDYYYKPEPIFYGTESILYMGVELEIDDGGENGNNARKLLDIDGFDRIYCKHDGSLDDGFEIVSHPCTLEYHMHNMDWFNIMEKAIDMGYTSHNAGTCGLHIHVSKKALGKTYDEQDKSIGNILYFIETYWNELLRLSRRTEEQLARWASRYGIEKGEKPSDILKKAKGNYNRYRAINLQNSNTVEFRMFRGTLKHSTFIATLQLVSLICEMCTDLTEPDIQQVTWADFVETIKDRQYAELLEYMTKREVL